MRFKKWHWKDPAMHPFRPFSLARKLVPKPCLVKGIDALSLAARSAAAQLSLVAVTRLLR